MIYNMYDVVLLPTSWCWRRYKGHSCTNDDRTSSTSTSGVRARYSVEASVPSSYSHPLWVHQTPTLLGLGKIRVPGRTRMQPQPG